MQRSAQKVGMAVASAQAVLDSLPHAVFVADARNVPISANAAAETFFGASVAVLQRRPLSQLIGPTSPLIALIGQVRDSGASMNKYALEIGYADVPLRTVDAFAAALPDAPGQVLVMLQLRTMAQMIERQLTHRGAARAVSGMAAVLAHEIKNPLSGIRGAAQLLEAGASEEDRPLAKLITDEVDRIRGLVDRMEVFGDERPIRFEPVNIHAVLDHVRTIAGTGFARGIGFVQAYDPSLPHVPGNRDKLVQCFLNLVKNAAEAIGEREGGQITLATAFRPGLHLTLPNSDARVSLPLEITVTDNGAGVPEALRPHLFEAFVTSKSGGTGLGLALVAKIIGDHGGIIECDHRPRGTAFRALMPMYSAAAGRAREKR